MAAAAYLTHLYIPSPQLAYLCCVQWNFAILPEYDCSIRGRLSLANSSIQVASFPVLWQCYDKIGNDSEDPRFSAGPSAP